MAIETTPLGFQKPDGNELVRGGDNAIAANAQKAEDLIQSDRGRLTTIEAKNVTQDNRLTAVESTNGTQNSRLSIIESINVDQSSAIDGIKTKNTTQDNRLTAVESINVDQSSAITGIKAKNTEQDGRLAEVESINVDQSSAIAGIKTKNTDQDGRLTDLETLGGLAPGDVSDATIRNIVANPASTTSVEVAKQYAKRGEIVVSVTDFGAKGDWVSGSTGANAGTDNLTAFKDAFNYATSITNRAVKLFIPAGKYRLSGEWNIYRPSSPRNDLIIEGESPWSTYLVSDFYGADKALIKSVDPTDVSRSSPTTLRNLQFNTVSRSGGTNPVFLNILGWSESNLEHIRFSSNNNTHLRLGSSLGVRMIDVVSLYGGKNYTYKNTNGITFGLAADGVLTSSADVFSAEDVGKLFFLTTTVDEDRGRYVISGYTDARTVQVDTSKPRYPGTGASGVFGPATVTTLAGSNEITANAPCFTASDVGRVVYIRNAAVGGFGYAVHRAKIVTVASPTVASIDTPAGRSVTNTPFAVPVIDLYSNTAAGTSAAARNTYMSIDGLRVEAFAGLAVGFLGGIQIRLTNTLLHGEHTPVDARASNGMFWGDDIGGMFDMDLDGAGISDVRIHICNINETVKIPYLSSRRVRNEPLIMLEDTAEKGALVEINSMVSYRHDDLGPEEFLIDKAQAAGNGRKLVYTGQVTMIGGNTQPRNYVGNGAYFTPEGKFVKGPTTQGGLFDWVLSGLTGARQMFEGIGFRRWSIGNAASSSIFNIIDETLALVRLQISGSGHVTPGADNTQDMGASGTRWRNIYGTAVIGGVVGPAAQQAVTSLTTNTFDVTSNAVVLNVTGGGTLNTITTAAAGPFQITLRNSGAGAITITHNTSSIMLNAAANKTLAQNQGMTLVRAGNTGNVWQEV